MDSTQQIALPMDTQASNKSSSETKTEQKSYITDYNFDHVIDLKFSEDLAALAPQTFKIVYKDSDDHVFRLTSPITSTSNKKILHDSETNAPIYKMKLDKFVEQFTFQIIDMKTDSVAFTVTLVGSGETSLNIWEGASTQGTPDMFTQGNLEKKDFRVMKFTKDGVIVAAHMSKMEHTFGNYVSGRDSILMQIDKGNNAALIVMIVTMVSEEWPMTSKETSEE